MGVRCIRFVAAGVLVAVPLVAQTRLSTSGPTIASRLAPAELNLTVTTSLSPKGGVFLAWVPVQGATGYRVERWREDAPDCCRAASPALSVTQWEDVPLPVGFSWVYGIFVKQPDGSEGVKTVRYLLAPIESVSFGPLDAGPFVLPSAPTAPLWNNLLLGVDLQAPFKVVKLSASGGSGARPQYFFYDSNNRLPVGNYAVRYQFQPGSTVGTFTLNLIQGLVTPVQVGQCGSSMLAASPDPFCEARVTVAAGQYLHMKLEMVPAPGTAMLTLVKTTVFRLP